MSVFYLYISRESADIITYMSVFYVHVSILRTSLRTGHYFAYIITYISVFYEHVSNSNLQYVSITFSLSFISAYTFAICMNMLTRSSE